MDSTSSTGDAESQAAALQPLQPDQIKEDPDAKPPFTHVKSEFGPGSLAIRFVFTFDSRVFLDC